MSGPVRTLRAGCTTCHGAEAFWTGPNAQAVAARHHQTTGHATWCDLSVRYGAAAPDPRQTDLEEVIASIEQAGKVVRQIGALAVAHFSSGGRPDAAPLTDPDAPADAPAGVSAPEGRSVETRRLMPRGARGRKPEIHAS